MLGGYWEEKSIEIREEDRETNVSSPSPYFRP